MKKTIAVLLLVMGLGFIAGAQTIRSNYISKGITHVSTEYESIPSGAHAIQLRLESADFEDGQTVYLLHFVVGGENAPVFPRGVKITFTTASGKIVRADQTGGGKGKAKYAIWAKDLALLEGGVKAVDIITGWNPEDLIQLSFKGDELGDLLRRHHSAIDGAKGRAVAELADIAGYSDNAESTMTTAKPIVGRGENCIYNIILVHLYYKGTDSEDFDLAVQIGTDEAYHISTDAPVVFTLPDGREISLVQTRDEENFVYLFPSVEDIRALASGVSSIMIQCEGTVFTDKLDASFSDSINRQYQALIALSPR